MTYLEEMNEEYNMQNQLERGTQVLLVCERT